jgi:hypothetical protein
LQRAIGEVPSAKALVEDIRRMRAANRSSDVRRD